MSGGLTIPVGGMPAAALPMPTSWEIIDGPVIAATDPAAGPMFVRIPDSQVVPELWGLSYEDMPAAAGNAIRAHARDHVGPFAWRNPVTGTVEQWRHAELPVVTFQNPQKASAQVTLERLTVHE